MKKTGTAQAVIRWRTLALSHWRARATVGHVRFLPDKVGLRRQAKETFTKGRLNGDIATHANKRRGRRRGRTATRGLVSGVCDLQSQPVNEEYGNEGDRSRGWGIQDLRGASARARS